MPDYVYLLENRLSTYQQAALRAVRDAAREAQMPLFLVGDAVRDLVCGNSVRELEVVIHGNTAELKKPLIAAGAAVWWENTAARRLSLRFPGSVLLELASARHTDYPKCGKPVYSWASIHEDLRSRDFTVNAMAISLNDGSFGLLMDPLNGVADIEVRQLRLVSNYGFLEEPARMIRATRLRVRLGFPMEERTQRRFDDARKEDMIQYLSDEERQRELEQIVHEEESLQVMAAHEADGWMKSLFPGWTTAKVDVEKLQALHDFSIQLQMQGVSADLSAPQAHYLTAKLSAKDLTALKEKFLRPGFVKAWEGLEASAAQLAKALTAKENAKPSACYKLLTTFAPEAVVWLGFTARQAGVKEKFEAFLKTWPEFKQKLPFALMAEMRITTELPGFADLSHQLFLRLIDGELTTEEEMRAFLEPFSPPAPPPPVSIKRSRSRKAAEIRTKSRAVDEDELAEDEDDEESVEIDEDSPDLDFRIGDSDEARILGDEDDGDDDDAFAHGSVGGDDEDVEDEEEEDAAPVRAKGKTEKEPLPRQSLSTSRHSAPSARVVPASPEKPSKKTAIKAVKPEKKSSAKPAAASRPSGKTTVSKVAKPTTTKPTSAPAKAATKATAKSVSKAAAKNVVAKSAASKSAASKAATKPVSKAVTSKPSAKAKPVAKRSPVITPKAAQKAIKTSKAPARKAQPVARPAAAKSAKKIVKVVGKKKKR